MSSYFWFRASESPLWGDGSSGPGHHDHQLRWFSKRMLRLWLPSEVTGNLDVEGTVARSDACWDGSAWRHAAIQQSTEPHATKSSGPICHSGCLGAAIHTLKGFRAIVRTSYANGRTSHANGRTSYAAAGSCHTSAVNCNTTAVSCSITPFASSSRQACPAPFTAADWPMLPCSPRWGNKGRACSGLPSNRWRHTCHGHGGRLLCAAKGTDRGAALLQAKPSLSSSTNRCAQKWALHHVRAEGTCAHRRSLPTGRRPPLTARVCHAFPRPQHTPTGHAFPRPQRTLTGQPNYQEQVAHERGSLQIWKAPQKNGGCLWVRRQRDTKGGYHPEWRRRTALPQRGDGSRILNDTKIVAGLPLMTSDMGSRQSGKAENRLRSWRTPDVNPHN